MKAKELAKILMMTPEAEVVIFMYNGGGDPLLSVKTVVHEDVGESSSGRDGGDFVEYPSGKVLKEQVILNP